MYSISKGLAYWILAIAVIIICLKGCGEWGHEVHVSTDVCGERAHHVERWYQSKMGKGITLDGKDLTVVNYSIQGQSFILSDRSTVYHNMLGATPSFRCSHQKRMEKSQ